MSRLVRRVAYIADGVVIAVGLIDSAGTPAQTASQNAMSAGAVGVGTLMVDTATANPGDLYSNGAFSTGPVTWQQTLTTQTIRNRFTPAEIAATLTLAYSGAGDVNVQTMLMQLQTVTEVAVNNPLLLAAMQYLITKTILTQARVNTILAV